MAEKIRVQVLSTGTELLRGRAVDTNLGFIAREFEKIGLEIAYHSTCGDDFARLVDELKLAASRVDVCVMTGGLGPTEDDLTRPAVEKAFHLPLRFDPKLWPAIRARFREFKIPMAAINRRQAFRPEGAFAIPNPQGTAPGFRLEVDDFILFVLPGPPREMQPMLLQTVAPFLARRRRKDWDLWEGKAIGVPEGDVDVLVKRIVGSRATYGLTAGRGTVSISVRAEGPARKKSLRELSDRIRRALGVRFLEGSLEETVGRLLLERRTTVAVAESCTGGLIAHRLTDVAGISKSLLEAVVAYSNESKMRRLGVAEALIETHGAVSAEVAGAMAEGIARSSGAEFGVATTGIAGPTGGSKRKPVGLVFTAVSRAGRTRVSERVFPGDRREVKERAANHALDLLRLALEGKRE